MSNKDLENYDTNEYHKEKVSNKYEEQLSKAEESDNPMEIYQKIINSKDSKNKNFEIYRLLTLALISLEKLNIEEFEETLKKFIIKYSKNKEPYSNDNNKIIRLTNKISIIESKNKDKKLKFLQILEDLLKEYEFMIDYFYVGIEICNYFYQNKYDEELTDKLSSIRLELDNSDINEEKDNILADLEEKEDELYDVGIDYEEKGINALNKRNFNEAIVQFMKAYKIYLALRKEDDSLNIIRYSFGASMLHDENEEFQVDTSPGLNYLINYFKNENIKDIYRTHQEDFTSIMNKLTDKYKENDNMESKESDKAQKPDKINKKDKNSDSQINSNLGNLLNTVKNVKDINKESEKYNINKDDNYIEAFEYYNENVTEFLEEHKNSLQIDLHGFRLKESLSIVKIKIKELQDKIFDENLKKLDLTIITGRGNKSWRHQPILHPNITIYLKKRHEFTVKTDQGVIYVTIYKKQLK